MNTQARKIWDALNPKLRLASDRFQRSDAPTPQQSLDACEGRSQPILLDEESPGWTIYLVKDLKPELLIDPNFDDKVYLCMKAVIFAYLVARAAQAKPYKGSGEAAGAFLDQIRAYKAPVKA